MKKTFLTLMVLALIGAFLFLITSRKEVVPVVKPVVDTAEKVIATILFSCIDAKTIDASFYKDKVKVILSDGRAMTLPQVISGSGARYANANESFVFWNKGNTAFVEEKGSVTFKDCIQKEAIAPPVQIPNPASQNCTKVGGNLVIQKRGDGAEFGLCYFEENRACEEWALMRGECPVGGRKTTGYDTIDQNYCAWLGGETLAVKNSQCTFKNGKVCSTIDFYNGKCTSVK